MSDDDHERTTALAKQLQAASHEFGAYTLSLAIRGDGHRRQSHPGYSPRTAVGHNRREEDMTDHATVDSDQRQRVRARLAELVDEMSFRRLLERQLVDTSNLGDVFGFFPANGDHGVPSPRTGDRTDDG